MTQSRKLYYSFVLLSNEETSQLDQSAEALIHGINETNVAIVLPKINGGSLYSTPHETLESAERFRFMRCIPNNERVAGAYVGFYVNPSDIEYSKSVGRCYLKEHLNISAQDVVYCYPNTEKSLLFKSIFFCNSAEELIKIFGEPFEPYTLRDSRIEAGGLFSLLNYLVTSDNLPESIKQEMSSVSRKIAKNCQNALTMTMSELKKVFAIFLKGCKKISDECQAYMDSCKPEELLKDEDEDKEFHLFFRGPTPKTLLGCKQLIRGIDDFKKVIIHTIHEISKKLIEKNEYKEEPPQSIIPAYMFFQPEKEQKDESLLLSEPAKGLSMVELRR